MALPVLPGRQPHAGVHEALCDDPQPRIIFLPFLIRLQIRDLEALPARCPHPANQVKGQFRAGCKIWLLHFQQQSFGRTFRQFGTGGKAADALRVHRQLAQGQGPFLFPDILDSLLPEARHLAQVVA